MPAEAGPDHLADHHDAAGPGGRRGGHLVLADGLQAEAQGRRPLAPPAGLPQPPLHHARTTGGALAGLLPILQQQSLSGNMLCRLGNGNDLSISLRFGFVKGVR